MIDIVKRITFLILAIMGISPLLAQEPSVEYSTISYAPLPARIAFVLEATEQTLLNEQVIEHLRLVLPQKGYSLDQQARYGIVINAELITPDYREVAPQRWQLLHLTFPNRSPARKDYFISLAIYDKQSGLYIWRGEAARFDETQIVDDIRENMINALVSAFGQTIKQAFLP